MLFIELLKIGLIIGALAFGSALLILLFLELGRLIIGFIKYLKLQKKLEKLEQQKNMELDFEKLQNDLEHWKKIIEN